MTFRNERTWQNAVDGGAQDAFHLRYEQSLGAVRRDFGAKYPMIIGGKPHYAKSVFADTSPADPKVVLGRFQKGTRGDARKAVAAAKRAFPAWSSTEYPHRVAIFERAADLLSERKFDLAAMMSFENGKNRYEAIADVDEAIDFVRWYAQEMRVNAGFEREMGKYVPNEQARSVLRPYGVWAVIAPFNFPLAIATGMTSGVTITGNTAVFKPASDTPLLGFKMVEALRDAGLPPGVVNYVTGPGSTVGQDLVDNPDVQGFVFTGSRAVGMGAFRTFTREHPKPIVTELGGKNATIVTATADLEAAADGVLRGAFGYGGQKCSASSRVLVDRKVKKAFLERLVEKAKAIRIGNPTDRDVYLGPLINAAAVRTYERAIAAIKRSRGRVLCGGTVLDREGGYFVEPTVVDGLPRGNKINREELFVPILSVLGVRDLDDAIELANAVDYGLTAGLFSRDPEEIRTFFGRIQAGVAYVNRAAGSTTGAVVGVQPFGGWKMSGISGKAAGGHYYLQQFLREQSLTTYA